MIRVKKDAFKSYKFEAQAVLKIKKIKNCNLVTTDNCGIVILSNEKNKTMSI